jgi:hypothetical protein
VVRPSLSKLKIQQQPLFISKIIYFNQTINNNILYSGPGVISSTFLCCTLAKLFCANKEEISPLRDQLRSHLRMTSEDTVSFPARTHTRQLDKATPAG